MKKKIQKPFDAEAAKGGAKVETRDGDSVRILCYDRKGPNFPIVALTKHNGIESCFSYTDKGKMLDNNLFDNYQGEHDLVIIEEVEAPKFNVGDCEENYNVFATEELAKSALAMARLSQLIANDKRYGGPVTDKQWLNNKLKKFTIMRINSRAVFNTSSYVYNFLAFHTEEQRQLFWEENESLIKDYLMIKDNFTLAD